MLNKYAMKKELLMQLVTGNATANTAELLAKDCDELGMSYVAGRVREYANDHKFLLRYVFNACPACASQNTSVKNFDEVWRDGEITCDECGTHVRGYDAG